MRPLVRDAVLIAVALAAVGGIGALLAVPAHRARAAAFLRNVLAIAGKEIRSIFYSPILYIAVVLFGFVNYILFDIIVDSLSRSNAQNKPPLDIYFGFGFLWLITPLFTPLLTMRLFAEEKRTGTFEVLLTAPVSDGEVVLGKFLAAHLFFLLLWFPALVFVGATAFVSRVDVGQVAASYAGLALVGGLFASIGLFTSSLTRNQIVAAITGMAILLGYWLLCVRGGDLSEAVGSVIEHASFPIHMDGFAKGIVDTRPMAFYASATAFFLFLTTKALEVRRWR